MSGIPFMMRRRDLIAGAVCSVVAGPAACGAAARERVSILDFLPPREHRLIAEGRSSYDCGPDLERGIAQTAPAGAILELPAGLYHLAPRHRLDHADTFDCAAAARLRSGTRIHGEQGAMIRMVPGYSSDQAPRAMTMFANTQAISDIELKGLILDMNGRGNPISPARADGVYNRFPQAHIFVSGGRGPEAARIDRVDISETVFRDSNGVSCIVMGQNTDPDAPLGRDWVVRNCRFLDNGMDTDDHSSIFAYADQVQTNGCTFANVAPFDSTGVNTAYEVHGSRQTISNCTFQNMIRGIWVANNYSSITSDTNIKNNVFRTIFYGVDFFNDRAEAKSITRTVISGNTFTFDDNVIHSIPALNFKVAVQIASEFPQQNIDISGNVVRKSGHATTSAFLVVTGGANGNKPHDAITAIGNQGTGLTFGSFIRTGARQGIGRLTIKRNRWSGLSPSAMMAIAAGDAVEHTGALRPIEALSLGGGSVQANDNQPSVKPIYINALVRHLIVEATQTEGTSPRLIELGHTAQLGQIQYLRGAAADRKTNESQAAELNSIRTRFIKNQ